ncbi:hypothetical protein H257_14765 [Aphanomyces astaci]|uniref:Reverse transcriptase domain-containing protein n=1 Tax=Aphanomyces astaci TaxID=112090 RepID=W4FRR9_APHAT|nr:hypothetical protein H257_14765 [Aphanomyces astaci]ETV69529.1 hypothetical protein H257_14765 [Aphanomyces astaci]|eukprot:XP_009840953.1 hypothetical protein H257_14765 [Aphanomyces astaci]
MEKPGAEWRIFHALKWNTATIPAQMPISRNDIIIDGMGRSTIFITIDLCDGFYQLLMRLCDVPKTAVSTPSGILWAWLVIPRGREDILWRFQEMMDDELAVMMQAMSVGIASCIMELDDERSTPSPQHKYVRPMHGYMGFLDLQNDLPHGGDMFYLEQVRLTKQALELLVTLSIPHVPNALDPPVLIMVTLQWLASGASSRSQEQLFQDNNHVTLVYYRQVGVHAITRGLWMAAFME